MHGPRKATRMIATTSKPVPATGPADRPLLRALLSRRRPAVMGILNVTPDSFSDGGRFIAPEHALAQARRMIAEGADIIDIGAESTRPYGAQPVSADDEMKRLRPVFADVASLGVPVSIDSMKSTVVAWALDAGAAIANDVWGLQRDPDMAKVLAARNLPVIIMHNRDQADASIDIMKDIAEFFARSLAIADRAGISRDNIVLDPGIGFGKTSEQSMTALARLNESSACRCWSVRRASASSVRSPRRSRINVSAARSRPIFWRRKAARGSSGPMMWRKPYRR
jgi:dihydropteroate synthase